MSSDSERASLLEGKSGRTIAGVGGGAAGGLALAIVPIMAMINTQNTETAAAMTAIRMELGKTTSGVLVLTERVDGLSKQLAEYKAVVGDAVDDGIRVVIVGDETKKRRR